MKYNKLVRDNIPEHIRKKGGIPVTHIADKKEYWQKLEEEVREFNEAETIEELADILEVIEAIGNYKKFDSSEIDKAKNNKARERGKFKKRIILDES